MNSLPLAPHGPPALCKGNYAARVKIIMPHLAGFSGYIFVQLAMIYRAYRDKKLYSGT